MSANNDERLIAAIAKQLKMFNFEVTVLPASSLSRTPDFVITRSGESFVFELKEKVDDIDALANEDARLQSGELVSFGESIGPNARVAEKTRDAVKQLQAYRSTNSFHLLWLHAGGRDSHVQSEQFRSTLYGITHIVGPDSPTAIRCYYFGHSEFFRSRALLAGAVISTPTELQLCINTLYERRIEFGKSAVVDAFKNGLLNPSRLEQEGFAYVADCDTDRKDQSSVLAYLQAKYGRPHLMNMNLGSLGARMRLPL